MTDRVGEGLALSDEALAALCAGEPTELATVDEIFCGLLWACELVNDVPRADQWMRAAAGRLRRSNVVAAFCRAHYGGILTAAGRWPEAEAELLAAVRHFDQGMSGRRAAAVIGLAGLRVRQGRLEEAAVLVQGLEQHPDVVPTLAALHLARGEVALARDLLERATHQADQEVPTVGASTMLGPLLALLVDVYLEQGSVKDAARVARRLGGIAQGQRGPYLLAAAAFAQGRVCVASGQGDARAWLHRALEGFARAQLPMEGRQDPPGAGPGIGATRTRGRHRPSQGGTAGLRTAGRGPPRRRRRGVAALAGGTHPDRPQGDRRPDQARGRGPPAPRAGLSNPEIADRLYITPKTVETHVGNLLAKLGLRNRAQAAAYATRHKISP
jgi:Bacterial regulatory proteins, luxR family